MRQPVAKAQMLNPTGGLPVEIWRRVGLLLASERRRARAPPNGSPAPF
jgi:hypothetical protein